MDKRERRTTAVKQRKWEVGTVIHVQGCIGSDGFHYWFESPEGWRRKDGLPLNVEIHGPFTTAAEAHESQRLVLLGPQCKLTEGARGTVH